MRILLAVDGSEESKAAIDVVTSRPWPERTVVRVLCVAQHGASLANTYVVDRGTLEKLEIRAQANASEAVARAAEALKGTGLDVETTVRSGDPRSEIVQEAIDSSSDLIVLGSHGRTGIKRWLLGSVAEYVVRHAPCSVEVARTTAPPRARRTVDVAGMFSPPPRPGRGKRKRTG